LERCLVLESGYMATLTFISLVAEADTGTKSLANSRFKSSGNSEAMVYGNSQSETKVVEEGCTSNSKGIPFLGFLLYLLGVKDKKGWGQVLEGSLIVR
jgi:hypothetical protein